MEAQLVMCDTNIFIHWFRGDKQTINKLMDIGLENIIISSIVRMELFLGCENKQELLALNKRINKYPIIYITEQITKQADKFIELYNLSHKLQIPDAFIGATAITYNLQLFTYNIKDFRFLPNIRLIQI
ncbi:MAG: hypothetical protein B6D61_05805 [Bacteroidetes bacterium 4484_249]|nr:MAG: hypothetical protein B6D61_05805 [Bacteroidetes bacterium 4484_249]